MKPSLAQEIKLMRMLRNRVPLTAACLLIAVAIAACNQPPAAPPAALVPAAAPTQTVVERGKMLVIGIRPSALTAWLERGGKTTAA